MLRIFDELPAGLLDVDATGLADALGGPSLIRIAGVCEPALLVATLLHGNETTGWDAIRHLLRRHPGGVLPRSLLLFIGNVEAARDGLRHLDGQPDFNRIWCGATGPEATMAAQVLAEARRVAPVACIDVHNSSGENPVYGCVHRLDDPSLGLAGHFASIAVLVTHPESLLSMALAGIAPSITLECGKPGNPEVARRVAGSLLDLMALARAPDSAHTGAGALHLLRTVARVRVPENISFSFDDGMVDLRFKGDLESYNFAVMPAGTIIAELDAQAVRGLGPVLLATDEHGRDLSERFFRRRGNTLVTATPLTPSLFTSNERIVRQDCLCYVMETI